MQTSTVKYRELIASFLEVLKKETKAISESIGIFKRYSYSHAMENHIQALESLLKVNSKEFRKLAPASLLQLLSYLNAHTNLNVFKIGLLINLLNETIARLDFINIFLYQDKLAVQDFNDIFNTRDQINIASMTASEELLYIKKCLYSREFSHKLRAIKEYLLACKKSAKSYGADRLEEMTRHANELKNNKYHSVHFCELKLRECGKKHYASSQNADQANQLSDDMKQGLANIIDEVVKKLIQIEAEYKLVIKKADNDLKNINRFRADLKSILKFEILNNFNYSEEHINTIDYLDDLNNATPERLKMIANDMVLFSKLYSMIDAAISSTHPSVIYRILVELSYGTSVLDWFYHAWIERNKKIECAFTQGAVVGLLENKLGIDASLYLGSFFSRRDAARISQVSKPIYDEANSARERAINQNAVRKSI